MEGIKYVNLIEISPVVIEIRGVENSELVVPINNTLVYHTAFLATDTQSCALIDPIIVGEQELEYGDICHSYSILTQPYIVCSIRIRV